jgi:tripartite-type tricarboxylate transporter receptor subunit TctC
MPYPSPARRALLATAVTAPAAALALGLAPRAAYAQALPARPIRFVVPFAAGGPTDLMARAAAGVLSAQGATQWIVENRPGAGGNVAAAYVAGAAPDGTTLLVAGQGILAINKPLFGKLSFEPERDFAWIGMLGSLPNVLIANTDVIPGATMKDLLDQARAQPGRVAYGSNGVGSLSHLKTELMAHMAGVKFLHVPYQGAAPQRTDLISGRIGFTQIGASAAVPMLAGNKLRALVVSTAKRSPALPEVPTLIESGFPDLDVPVWFAATAHSATPAPVLAALRQALAAATATAAYRAEMAKQLGSADQVSVEAAEAMLARERRIWTEAVKITGATASG